MELEKENDGNLSKEKSDNKIGNLVRLKKDFIIIKEKIRQMNESNKEQQNRRVKQNKNTIRYFVNVFKYLKDKAFDSVSGFSCCYKKSNCDDENHTIDPVFLPGFINLDLLHSLCYTNGIVLNVIYDEVENNAYMYFEYCPLGKLKKMKYDESKEINIKSMNSFHQYLIDSKVQFDEDFVQKTI